MHETITIPVNHSQEFKEIYDFFTQINKNSSIHYVPKFLTEEMRKNYEEWKKNQH